MIGAKIPNELNWPSLHEMLSVLARFTHFDCHPFRARIMFLNSIVPNSSKMKKGEDRERKRKNGRGERGKEEETEGGKKGGRKQRKSKRKEGKKKNGIKQTGMESRRNEVPNEAPLR